MDAWAAAAAALAESGQEREGEVDDPNRSECGGRLCATAAWQAAAAREGTEEEEEDNQMGEV